MDSIIKLLKKEVSLVIKKSVENNCINNVTNNDDDLDIWHEITHKKLGSIDVNFWSEKDIIYYLTLYDVKIEQGFEVTDVNTPLTIFSGSKKELLQWMK